MRDGNQEYFELADHPPALYIEGEFIGGCDIVKEMYASGDPPEEARRRGQFQ